MDEYLTVIANTVPEFDGICNHIAKDGWTPCFVMTHQYTQYITKNPAKDETIIESDISAYIQQWRRPAKQIKK